LVLSRACVAVCVNLALAFASVAAQGSADTEASFVGCFRDTSVAGDVVQHWADGGQSFKTCMHLARLDSAWQFVLQQPQMFARGEALCGWGLKLPNNDGGEDDGGEDDSGSHEALREVKDVACEAEFDSAGYRLGGRTSMAVYQFNDVEDDDDTGDGFDEDEIPLPGHDATLGDGSDEEDEEEDDDGDEDYEEGDFAEGLFRARRASDDEDGDGLVDVRPKSWMEGLNPMLGGLLLGKHVYGPGGMRYTDAQLEKILSRFSGSVFSSSAERDRAAGTGMAEGGGLASNRRSAFFEQDPRGERVCRIIDGRRVCSDDGVRDPLSRSLLGTRAGDDEHWEETIGLSPQVEADSIEVPGARGQVGNADRAEVATDATQLRTMAQFHEAVGLTQRRSMEEGHAIAVVAFYTADCSGAGVNPGGAADYAPCAVVDEHFRKLARRLSIKSRWQAGGRFEQAVRFFRVDANAVPDVAQRARIVTFPTVAVFDALQGTRRPV
jgi:hypothetical protein